MQDYLIFKYLNDDCVVKVEAYPVHSEVYCYQILEQIPKFSPYMVVSATSRNQAYKKAYYLWIDINGKS